MEQMLDVNPLDQHEVVGEKAPVTTPPQRFGAHDCYGLRACNLEQVVDSRSKLETGHVVGIGSKLVVAQRLVWRSLIRPAPSSQVGAPPVVDLSGGKPFLHRLPTELGVATAARIAANVDNSLYLRAP